MFKPWDNPVTERLFKKMQDEGLTSSGKFREKQVKDFCAEHEWFRDDVAYLLSSIYDRNLVSETEIVENAEKLLVEDNATPISGDVSEIVDEKVEEPKKPAKKTTAKKSTAKSDVKVTKVK
jgi:hypothetical protein